MEIEFLKYNTKFDALMVQFENGDCLFEDVAVYLHDKVEKLIEEKEQLLINQAIRFGQSHGHIAPHKVVEEFKKERENGGKYLWKPSR